MDDVLKRIIKEAEKRYDASAIKDGFGWLVGHYDAEAAAILRELCVLAMKSGFKGEYFELYKIGLLVSAPYDFDCYMQYLEVDRKPEERFYMPRRRVMKRYVESLQDLADGRITELFISMPPRVGKALADDTPILTRKGWKNHGDLVVGDEVIGMDGKFKRVIAVHPKCDLNVLMEFTNGEKIQCHENHEWLFYDRATGKERLAETKYYEGRKLSQGVEGKRGHRYTLQVPYKNIIKGEGKELPLDPYTLGVWLGDGANRNPRICNADVDKAIIDRIVKNGTPIRWQTRHKTTGVMYYDFDIRKQLQSVGMCYSRRATPKHIPEEYLTAGVKQRLMLLAGLIDTDGSYRTKENRYDFSTCDESLKDTFIELVSTFGWRCSINKTNPYTSSSGVNGQKPTYTISFNPTLNIPCALPRKQNYGFSEQRAIALKSITRVAPKQGNCITVEGGMYLAGRTMIPTHNTTLAIMFTTWLMGRDSEHPNLYCSYSDIITKAFYNGVLEIMTDADTYNYRKIFPYAAIARTNAQDETIDIGRRKHYPTLTCRSLYGTLNGACDAENGVIISDDLIGGIEEAMNKDRLINAWAKVDNNLLPRGKQGTRYLWIGTRWSVIDPAGIRQDLLLNDPNFEGHKWRSINIPALNDLDESNFEYKYGVGFDTKYYKERRASFERNNDMPSWNAQYLGLPIEREGTVFSPDDLMYYNGTLPDREPSRIFMAIDPAWGGGDFVAAPVCYQYDTGEVYIHDVVYDNGDKEKTIPLIARKAEENGVTAMYVEASRTTKAYAEEVDRQLRKRGLRVNIQTSMKNAIGKNKNDRILAASPEIRNRMVFRESGTRKKDYELFMQNVFSFKMLGKNKNDDAPDSLQMAITYAFPAYDNRITVAKRFW